MYPYPHTISADARFPKGRHVTTHKLMIALPRRSMHDTRRGPPSHANTICFDTQTDRQTDRHADKPNPVAHARRGLTTHLGFACPRTRVMARVEHERLNKKHPPRATFPERYIAFSSRYVIPLHLDITLSLSSPRW